MTNSTILYVDDQPSHLALFRKAFERDYMVITAASGPEGLEIIRKNKVFLVIADHHMPLMSGIDFLEKVQSVSPQATQALLTAFTDAGVLKEAQKRTKIQDLLPKPWKRETIKKFIDGALEKYRIEFPDPASRPDAILPTSEVTLAKLFQGLNALPTTVADREARRIFLNHVEPPLKKFVPTIRRPEPELLAQARQAVVAGRLDEMERFLRLHLEVRESSSETVPSLLNH